MSPIAEARRGLAGMGKSAEEIEKLIKNCRVDPAFLDRFTEQARRVDPRQKPAKWAFSGGKLIVRSK